MRYLKALALVAVLCGLPVAFSNEIAVSCLHVYAKINHSSPISYKIIADYYQSYASRSKNVAANFYKLSLEQSILDFHQSRDINRKALLAQNIGNLYECGCGSPEPGNSNYDLLQAKEWYNTAHQYFNDANSKDTMNQAIRRVDMLIANKLAKNN